MRGKILALCMFLCIATGCTELKYHDLYCITDKAVESLYTEYESYGIFGGREEYTPQKDYKVMPIGRLINVRIEHVATTEEYESLLQALKSHYKGDSRVFDVYRCNAGTVMIDCRR